MWGKHMTIPASEEQSQGSGRSDLPTENLGWSVWQGTHLLLVLRAVPVVCRDSLPYCIPHAGTQLRSCPWAPAIPVVTSGQQGLPISPRRGWGKWVQGSGSLRVDQKWQIGSIHVLALRPASSCLENLGLKGKCHDWLAMSVIAKE